MSFQPQLLPVHQTSKSQACCSISEQERKDKPWKYEGYAGFTKWMARSSDYFIIRRFNALNARIILKMQDEIVCLEDELQAVDDECMAGPDETGRATSMRHDHFPRRKKILDELQPKMKEYNEYITIYSGLRGRPAAQQFQMRSVANWFYNHEYAIDKEEQEFASKEGDLISLVPKDKSILQQLIESMNDHLLEKLFRARPRADRPANPTTHHMSDKKIRATVTCIIVFSGLCVLVGPIWWLNAVQDTSKRLGIITGFILVFTLILSLATVNQPFQILAGTAAYAAVLMVFLQQQPVSNDTLQRP